MSQPCRLPVGELRKIVRLARRANYLVGPAKRGQLMELFESHAKVHEDVAQVLEGPTTVAILKSQRDMLKDMYHSENPTKMDRTALLRYIYFTAAEYGWEYPDMDEYEQRANIGKACAKSRPIGKSAKPPAGILPKKDRPQRALSRHQKFMSQKMRDANMRSTFPDAKQRFIEVSALWNEQKDEIAAHDRVVANRRRARQQAQDDADEIREERARTRRQAAAARKKEAEEFAQHQRDKEAAAARQLRKIGRVPKRRPARAASRR